MTKSSSPLKTSSSASQANPTDPSGVNMSQKIISTSAVLALLIACGDKSGSGADLSDTGFVTTYDDADRDGIIDAHDGLTEDADGDGFPNYQDMDSDGDTVKDKVEAGDNDPLTLPVDSDSDGIQDFLDLDSDNNCVPDKKERNPVDGVAGDQDGDGIGDYADPDNDGDGISDVHEIGLDCAAPDSDMDGTPDYMDIDSDGDGIGDMYEAGTSEWEDDPRDTDEDGVPDYLDSDSDGDGIPDSEEGGMPDPMDVPPDTDGDGDYDFCDTDSDGDSLSDWDENNIYGTDPFDPDTDGDGYSDGGEITAGTDPMDPTSAIEGLYVEVPERTGVEDNFEFELRIQMGDVAFLLDTTCSMSSTAHAMSTEFSAIVTSLSALIPDAEYGVATYDDYAYGSFGYASSGDKPFILRQQITDNTAAVQGSLSSVDIHFGGDGPESSMEAIYQGATGDGYDQNCNGVYDAATDVKPFIADAGDPFAGAGGQSYSEVSSSGGQIGGFGFRDYALPVLVYATDNYLRDSEAGYGTPGGCPLDAAGSDVAEAVNSIGGYLIGIAASSWGTAPGGPQMEALAAATGSYADTDGDGMADDLLVFDWNTSSSTVFRETVTTAIEELINSISFTKVELQVEGDEWGFVTSIDPPFYDNIEPSAGIDVLDFTLNFRGVVAATTEDQLFHLTLNVVGDNTVLLDTLDIIVVVPGTAY